MCDTTPGCPREDTTGRCRLLQPHGMRSCQRLLTVQPTRILLWYQNMHQNDFAIITDRKTSPMESDTLLHEWPPAQLFRNLEPRSAMDPRHGIDACGEHACAETYIFRWITTLLYQTSSVFFLQLLTNKLTMASAVAFASAGVRQAAPVRSVACVVSSLDIGYW